MTTSFSLIVSLNSMIFGPCLGRLLVRMNERRRHQFDGLARQLEILGRQCRRGGDECGDGCAQQCGAAGEHDTLLFGVHLNVVVPLCPGCGKASLFQRKLRAESKIDIVFALEQGNARLCA